MYDSAWRPGGGGALTKNQVQKPFVLLFCFENLGLFLKLYCCDVVPAF